MAEAPPDDQIAHYRSTQVGPERATDRFPAEHKDFLTQFLTRNRVLGKLARRRMRIPEAKIAAPIRQFNSFTRNS